MSTYNDELYIEESLQSILNQTLADFELIIYDDCSSDHTVEKIRAFQDPRIQLICNEENCGLEDTISLGYHMDNGGFRGITNIDKSLLTYQPQIESDYPDLVAVDTKRLKKDLWNPDPNYLYDFICAYREVKIPWRTEYKKFLCYTTYEKATKVLIVNAVNQNSLIQKKKINLI